MYSEKLLLRAITSLRIIFEKFSTSSGLENRKDVFISATSQCDIIINAVERNDISSAKDSWRVLMQFADDSIGPSEEFLDKYEPIRQKIINAGLQ